MQGTLTERLLGLTLASAEWVLWLLLALSAVSIGVMIERALRLRPGRRDLDELRGALSARLAAGDRADAAALLERAASPESRIALAGLAHWERGADAVSEAIAAARTSERLGLERALGFLGTVGSNAPFIGLFGTVLGIIKAFHDLAQNRGAGPEVVMGGISEALVATAVGLLVAIPAVLAFNHFQGRVRRILGRADALAHTLLVAADRRPSQERG